MDIPENGPVALDLISALRAGLSGRYEVDEEIGRGGMATVFGGRDLATGRAVAIKLLHPDLAKAVGGQRFLREIAILSRLSNPNILPVLDSGSIELVSGLEVPWYAMPLVRDETLRARLKREGPLPVPVALGYTRDLCAALSHAHSSGFIHRDIKPENILISGGHAVLADFGIARAITVAGGDTLSSTGIVVGTPAYMSPEQSLGSPILDGRSDLYSVGVVLYEMLSGQPPFSGITPQAVSARHQFEQPPPLGIVRPGLPSGLQPVVERALAKVAADRHQTAAELDDALSRPHETTSARGGSRRTSRLAVLLSAVLVAAVAWLGLSTILAPDPLDTSRFVVLPFEVVSRSPRTPIGGQEAEDMVLDALSRWTDVGVVSSLTVTDALLRSDGDLTLKKVRAIARSTGAGRLIWGSIKGARDSTRITGAVYDVASGREIRTATVWLPQELNIGELSSKLAELTFRLVLPGRPTPTDAVEATGAKSIAAYVTYAAGDSALNRWNLDLARKRYLEALTLDPDYPNANLKLALVGHWLEESPSAWRGYAERAAGAKERLTRSNRLTSEGLLGLADGEYPRACQRFRQLIGLDSLDFRGWFGLGECLTSDNEVVPDSTSPSGWSFRSSYAEGIRAYARALTVVPASHLAYGGATLKRLSNRLITESDRLRLGTPHGMPDSVFVAYPSLTADTLAFTPHQASDVVATANTPATWQKALRANRKQLVRITTVWLDQFPQSRVAMLSQAEALELAGKLEGSSPSAVGLVQQLRAGVDPAADLPLAIRDIRLRVKTFKYTAARLLAESVLAVPPRIPEEGVAQAGVAALIGRADRAAELMGQYANLPFSTSSGDLVSLPPDLRKDANRLLVYAGFGAPADSIKAIAARIRQSVGQRVPASQRESAMDAALFRPTLLAFPLLGTRGPEAFRLVEIEHLLARNERDSARAAMEALTKLKLPEVQAEVPPDFALLQARLWAMTGDTAGTVRRLEMTLTNSTRLSGEFVTDPTQAAAIGGMLELYSRVRPGSLASDTSLRGLWGDRR